MSCGLASQQREDMERSPSNGLRVLLVALGAGRSVKVVWR